MDYNKALYEVHVGCYVDLDRIVSVECHKVDEEYHEIRIVMDGGIVSRYEKLEKRVFEKLMKRWSERKTLKENWEYDVLDQLRLISKKVGR